jgi:hypothetical protein
MNIISLEFSETPMAPLVRRPVVVDQLDWTTRFWPSQYRDDKLYPKVNAAFIDT